MALALTTELEAVNTMLEAIGMVPINSFVDDLSADVQMARNMLARVSRSVQKKGWHFNTEADYPLSLDTSNNIPLGSNLLKVAFTSSQASNRQLTRRGTLLYDATNHTFTFSSALKANVVLFLNFEDLPEAARDFITIRAARQFHDKVVGSTAQHQFSQEDEAEAEEDFKSAEGDTANHSIFDNYDVASVLDRHEDFIPLGFS